MMELHQKKLLFTIYNEYVSGEAINHNLWRTYLR